MKNKKTMQDKKISKTSSFPQHKAQQITTFCFDLDDTLTTHGKMSKEAYSTLWDLAEAGLRLVAVTGRPAGWADQIARWWPVSAVVAENGALVFEMKKRNASQQPFGMEVHFTQVEGFEEAKKVQKKLQLILEEILEKYPMVQMAKDQPYRLWDLAIDIGEDIEPCEAHVVQGICDVFTSHGAICKVSSIHVNGWFGNSDKIKGIEYLFDQCWNENLEQQKDNILFIGDSPNDEPLFAYFPHSFGVANIQRFLPSLQTPPAYLCEQEEGNGFIEVAKQILECRKEIFHTVEPS